MTLNQEDQDQDVSEEQAEPARVLWTEDAWSEETQKLGQPLGQPPGHPRLTGQERNMRRTSNMRQTVQGSNASHPQPISSKWGGGKGKLARKCGNLAPSLHAPLL